MIGRESREGEKPELVFSDLLEGRSFRVLKYPVTEELIQEYIATTGDHHPLYGREAKDSDGAALQRIAPPGLAAIYSRLSYLQDHTMPSGGVLARQEFEFLGPIHAGDMLRVMAKVRERLVDEKGRRRVTFLIDATNQRGEPISITRLYAIWPK